MVPSAVINEAVVFLTVLSVRRALLRAPQGKRVYVFRFFTVLSNVFCALTAMLLLLFELGGSMPRGAVALKYMATCAVTVTFLTVLLFLWPSAGTYKGLWDGPELIMHLVTPLLSILSFLCFEKGNMSGWMIPLGIIPVALYGWLYLDRVVLTPQGRGWDDFYGFNQGGRWKLSFGLMLLGAAVISIVLWWI